MARVALPESRIHARRRRRRIIVASVAFIVLLLVLGGLVWLSRAPFLRITTITVEGEHTVSAASIVEFVQHHISGYNVYVFAKNNIFLYPKTYLDQALPAAMPTIASADTHAVNFHTIAVNIIERQPKALWCGTSVSASSSDCFLLDQGGAAYAPADNGFNISGQDASAGYKRYYGTLTGSSTPQQYLTPEAFTALGALVDAIAANQPQENITGIYVDQNNDVHMSFSSGFTLLFTLSTDGGDVYSRFQLALQSNAFAGHTIDDFQYLDLRFGDRLYYKLR